MQTPEQKCIIVTQFFLATKQSFPAWLNPVPGDSTTGTFLLGRVSPLGVFNGVIAMFFAIFGSLVLLELTRRNTILTALLCPRKGPQ
jgi:hypothetical protein